MSGSLYRGAGAEALTESQGPATLRSGSPSKSLTGRVRVSLPLIIFLVALACRMVALGIVQQWPVTPDSDLWKSGLEIVNIATSITSHRGFSSPFAVPSGPTAWIPPVYPYFLAAVFSLFGLRSNLAAFVILFTQAFLSALICFPIYSAGTKALGEKTGQWACWAWALFPYAVLIPVLFIWETALSALLLAWLWHLSMDLPKARTPLLLGIGVLWSVAALTNTALLSLMPFFLLSPYRSKLFTKSWLRPAFTIGLVFALVVSPWFLRNWHTLGVLVPLRSNFGEELWLGNHDGGSGRIALGLSPSDNDIERERYRRTGEVAYIAQRKHEALTFISQHPGGFIRGVFFRFRYWWYAEGESAPVFYLYRLITLMAALGIVFVWRTRTRGADLPIIALIVFPLVYYLTDVYARYRHPIEPFMILLGAFAASQCFDAIKSKVSNKSMV